MDIPVDPPAMLPPSDLEIGLSSVRGVSVVVVDDHDFFRRGVSQLLAEHGYEVLGEASSARRGLELAERLGPDVVVMDMHMPGMSGIDATRLLCERAPGTKVLMLTVVADEEHVMDALAAGAIGYLLKDAPVEEILGAVHAAADDDSVISPRIARKLVRRVSEQRPPAPLPAPGLTDRELEVLALLVEGHSNAEIADRLILSRNTVKNHISRVFDKLGVDNRTQAAVRAVGSGLLLPGEPRASPPNDDTETDRG